ncbi:MAG: hypothetical protein Q4D99_07450 [Bacillota bacterium]|nr:hypothetical protein [Bacillota bacterium]
MKQLINPDSFKKSIRLALQSNYDKSAALERVRKRLAATDDGILHFRHDRGYVNFYEKINDKQKYIPKKSEHLYNLARRKYLSLLLHAIEDNTPENIASLQALIDEFVKGNLDIARIVMTYNQYNWFKQSFLKKKMDLSNAKYTNNNVPVRSKSERDIGNELEDFAVPFHYEEKQLVKVFPLVRELENDLRERGFLSGNLCHLRGSTCIWHVPKELEWMNCPGSIWRAYNPRTGNITIFNDFKILLADNEIIFWEHEGLCNDFIYRSNASERELILKYTNTVKRGNFISTFEIEVSNRELLRQIISSEILPRLWF